MTTPAAKIPNAAKATFFAFHDAQLSVAEALIASGSDDRFPFASDFFSACARTDSGEVGMESDGIGEASCGFGGSFGMTVVATFVFAVSTGGGTSVFANSIRASGLTAPAGFEGSLTGASAAGSVTGSGAFRITDAVERISPSGEVSVTAHSE